MNLKPLSKKGLFVYNNSNKKINISSGAVRSTKTFSSIFKLIQLAIDPLISFDIKGIIAGRTTRSIERNILDLLSDILPKSLFSYTRSLNQCKIGKRFFDVVGASDERAKEKIQGATYGIGYFDEVALFPQSFFEMALTRFLSIANYRILATCNTESPYHWLKTNYIDKKDLLDINYFHFTLDDNPYLPKENLEELKRTYTGVFYQRYILGLWVLAQGLIYSMFDKSKHLFDNLWTNENTRYKVSIDYGTKNPFAMGLFTQQENKHFLVKEFYYCGRDEEKLKTNEEYATNLNEFVGNKKIERIDIDPSAIAFITTVKKDYPKLGALIASNTDNSVKEGIENVSSVLNKNELFIHKDCKNTIKEFETYSWNEKKAMKTGYEEPLKENDHCMDFIRYYIRNNWYKKIAQVSNLLTLNNNKYNKFNAIPI